MIVKREADKVSYLHSSLNGKHMTSHENDLYETEVSVSVENSVFIFPLLYILQLITSQVILRAREAEMQFLRQEALCLREELKLARMVQVSPDIYSITSFYIPNFNFYFLCVCVVLRIKCLLRTS